MRANPIAVFVFTLACSGVADSYYADGRVLLALCWLGLGVLPALAVLHYGVKSELARHAGGAK